MSEKHIVKTPGCCGGRPRIAGTRMGVNDVFNRVCLDGVAQFKQDYPYITSEQFAACWAYYHEHTEEIDEILEEQQRSYEELAAVRATTAPASPAAP